MMHAITHLNPVLGVDVHIIQPPGPVPPIPIPHPYVGIVFDPADYVPIIGSTVSIHGLPRAIAGTAGKPIPSHIPIGGTFIKPPGNEDEDFMGSSTVAMDGDAASYMALPVISCQDVGMPPPFRTNPKKKGKMKSMVLPTSVMMPIPAGPPVLIGGSPTISLMALGMRFGMAALGKGLKRLAKTKLARKIGKAFKAAKKKAFRNMKPGFVKCKVLKAEPVDVVTGEVVVDQQDFSIPGRIPIEWNRHYGSQSERMGVCGYGWETPADARLEFDYDGSVIFHDGTGAPSYFGSLPVDGPVMEPVDGGTLHKINAYYAVRLKGGLSYSFPIPKEPVEEVVVEYVMDLCKNYLRYVRDKNGLREIVESAGRRIEVTSKNGLIKGMRLLHLEYEKPHPLVRFEYGEDGDLITVFDALEHPYCFGYRNHCLVQHTNRNGLSFYYEYDEYFPDGRCLHTWGDGGLYNYNFKFLDIEGTTKITDSLGHTSSVKYNNRYQIVQEINALGGVTHYEYDDVGRTLAVVDPAGNRTEYEYDRLANLIRLTRPDGSRILYEFNANNRATTITDPNEFIWQQRWDERGLLTKKTSPRGSETLYQYEEKGDLIKIVAPTKGKTIYQNDRYGNTIRVIDAHGNITSFEFDPLGAITSMTDPSGSQLLYKFDKKYRLVNTIYPSGVNLSYTYDHEDNLIQYRDENGQITILEYSGLGEVSKRIYPDGTAVTYQYDAEERLIGVTNERGETYILERNPRGRVIQEADYWNNIRTYSYDALGNLIRTIDPLGRKISFKYDLLGRLVGKIFGENEVELYSYDSNGNVIKTQNEHITVERIFDAEDNIVEEHQGSFTIKNKYDLNGNRIKRSSSHGNQISFEYDKLNNVKSITINGSEPIKIERDSRGLIKDEKINAQVHRKYEYNADGLLIHQRLFSQDKVIAERDYEYDPVGSLTSRIGANKGKTYFTYDPRGRIRRYVNPQGIIKLFLYDPAGDLLKPMSNQMRKPGERLVTYDGTDYKFDAAGNLVERSHENDTIAFEWDENNRLIAANHKNRSESFMVYDCQGRRISKKTNDKETYFAWDGNNILSDSTGGDTVREFIFYPDSFKPLAVINEKRNIFYFHNDNIGLPHKVFDELGNLLWSAQFGPFGNVEKILIAKFNNPIRLQGQYYDEELDLCYNRYRYYDPRIGSFISWDPLGIDGGVNLYRYAPNVWSWFDPLGLMCGKIHEVFDNPSAAIGDVNGVAELVGQTTTKSPFWHANGFTKTHYYRDSQGVKHTVFHNRKTGQYAGAHTSSGQDID